MLMIRNLEIWLICHRNMSFKMKNLSVDEKDLFDQINHYYLQSNDIDANKYNIGVADYGLMCSDFFSYILDYFDNIDIKFYFYDVDTNLYQMIKCIHVSNENDFRGLSDFYFFENGRSTLFSYFYIAHDRNNNFITISNESMDLSLIFMNNLAQILLSQGVDDYFVFKCGA